MVDIIKIFCSCEPRWNRFLIFEEEFQVGQDEYVSRGVVLLVAHLDLTAHRCVLG